MQRGLCAGDVAVSAQMREQEVECCNDECGWEGLESEAVHPKHDPDFFCCPECHERVYPAPLIHQQVNE